MMKEKVAIDELLTRVIECGKADDPSISRAEGLIAIRATTEEP